MPTPPTFTREILLVCALLLVGQELARYRYLGESPPRKRTLALLAVAAVLAAMLSWLLYVRYAVYYRW